MRLVDGVVGEGSGDVLVTHAPVVSSVVGLGLSLAVVAMKAVIAVKALGTPVVVAGGMSVSVAWFRLSLNEQLI